MSTQEEGAEPMIRQGTGTPQDHRRMRCHCLWSSGCSRLGRDPRGCSRQGCGQVPRAQGERTENRGPPSVAAGAGRAVGAAGGRGRTLRAGREWEEGSLTGRVRNP
ncbi:unnamed protein product [Rangifer tarandus platyrhynchus]|uniref:Uncharacterized protein n=1 Tax=Rangifer tarandus platyrhynchus TaxID=3082113 RepID=A0AC59YS13_RANTA